MKQKTKTCERRRKHSLLVVAPASAYTWAVAFSRRLIPGAVFNSRDAALAYAATLAKAAGLRAPEVRVLGDA